MKILYAIQGTGNGHLSRAIALLPILSQRGTVDVLISGNQSQLSFPYPIAYQCYGLTFVSSARGGIDVLKTLKGLKPLRFLREVRALPLEQYDLVISDFEPVSAWACKWKGITCVELSHQAAVRAPGSPQSPLWFPLGRWIIKHYCPSTISLGFHFERFTEDTFYPIIREEILAAKPTRGSHNLVYLTAFDRSFLHAYFSKLPGIFRIYTKEVSQEECVENLTFCPIGGPGFLSDLISAQGIICGAGFELPAEALYLHKKLLVVPYANHFEQHCNAHALKQIGVTVLFDLTDKTIDECAAWCISGEPIEYRWSNQLSTSIDAVFTAASALEHAIPVID
ncbi:MAG: glycosyl transferase [Crocinitomicaceae bacterium]|nr:glycosyl transferase [Crocinitomicaceae bacterium]